MKKFVYKTTNLINGKIYIGKKTGENDNYLGSGSILALAINKYGKEKFKIEILEECESEDHLNEREIYWINFFNSRDRLIGYNITKGGNGGWDPSIWKGRSLSESHRKNISKNHRNIKGDKNPMFGKKHSQKTCDKISEARKGMTASDFTKTKMSLSKQGDKNNMAKLTSSDVIKIRIAHKNGDKVCDLAVQYNVKRSCISKIINRITWKNLD